MTRPISVAIACSPRAQIELARALQKDADITVVAMTDGKPCQGIDEPDVTVVDVTSLGDLALAMIQARMRSHPVPVIALVSASGIDPTGVRALAAGAVEAVQFSGNADEGRILRERVRVLRGVAVVRRGVTPDRAPARPMPGVVAIGASTGGPSAVATVLGGLAGLHAPVLVVQHIHEEFCAGFVSWLDDASPLPVSSASAGETALPGRVYVAPPRRHLRLTPGNVLVLADGPAALHRPSVDVLFQSVAVAAPGSVGVLLTGMGSDGASGLLAMRTAGALTIAQDEATSAVYGMPKVAHVLGAATHTLPLQHIAPAILASHVRSRP